MINSSIIFLFLQWLVTDC